MQKNAVSNPKFIQELEGLRGWAILAVFISHCSFGLNSYGVNSTMRLGSFGVSVFIMMSGYLLMFQHSNKPVNIIQMCKRRLKKFYPLHIVTLGLSIPFAFKALLGFDVKSWIALALNASLLQTWIPSPSVYFSFNAVSWYLSLTMFFVVISPIVVKLWNRIDLVYHQVAVCLTLILLEIVVCISFQNNPKAHYFIYIFPIMRLVDYIIGGGI